MSAPSLREVIALAVPGLEAAGVDEARRDAEILLCLALGCDRAHLIGYPDRAIEPDRLKAFQRMAARRAAREPMSQIAGCREFWSLDFEVTAATLTPRPESEILVETVLDLIGDRRAPRRLLDLGTGTGCLLLTLLVELPGATGVGVDLSAEALAVAHANSERLGLGDRSAFVQGDWAASLDERFDVVVANPPYVAADDFAGLEPEVARWEPRLALDGGRDGLDAYRCIVPELCGLLRDDGFAVLEHGPGQAAAIEELAAACGLKALGRRQDLAQHDRCLVLGR